MNRSSFAGPLFCLFALALSGLLANPSRIAAQAAPAGAKALDISVYGGYVNSAPDYAGYRNTGEAFGVDFSHSFFHFPVTPALDFRTNLTNGPAVGEHTYLPGIRGTATFLRVLHPYATVLIGPGTLHLNFATQGYQNQGAVVYSLGGGLNVDVGHNIQLMGDFQYQHWNFGGGDTLTPSVFLFGATYHIPFRPYPSYAR